MAKSVSPRNTSRSKTLDEESTCVCDVESVSRSETGNESRESDDESEKSHNNRNKKSLWQTILEESKESARFYEKWLDERNTNSSKNVNSPANYLDREIFPILLTALEKMLNEARNLGVLRVQKSHFNGLDYLAEYLWNSNPKRSTKTKWLDVYEIPQFKLLMKLHPRPIFPKSWLWPTDEAATRIQRYVRGWLVRKREDVQEMRQFWKVRNF
ncbi:IQ domain-containing protein K-like [Venturia canescens]|uniref:IQ domain-containing protein K-like n=1 Tax=Venturia canescens TaxID=32260 RepID=UPI001C9CD9D6|nr:IQ domain-containing protein K-like [Venturia canescens]